MAFQNQMERQKRIVCRVCQNKIKSNAGSYYFDDEFDYLTKGKNLLQEKCRSMLHAFNCIL